jgi:hypothetical protein
VIDDVDYLSQQIEQNSPNAVTEEKAAEIAVAFMTTFYQYGSARLRRRNFGQARSVLADRTRLKDQRDTVLCRKS